MRIGLFFGSFNPVHHGHLIIAEHFLNFTNLQEIWLVVSPQNPFKHAQSLLNEQHRLHLVKTAIEGSAHLRASSVEFKLPKPSYTIHTLQYLKEQHPRHEFSILMGSDSLQNLPNWKHGNLILRDYPIYVYLRPGFPVQQEAGQITVLEVPLLQISSTHIRELIAAGKSIRYLVPDAVKEEIERAGYYGNSMENPSRHKA